MSQLPDELTEQLRKGLKQLMEELRPFVIHGEMTITADGHFIFKRGDPRYREIGTEPFEMKGECDFGVPHKPVPPDIVVIKEGQVKV